MGTIDRFLHVPHVHGQEWGRRQAQHYAKRLESLLDLAPPSLKGYADQVRGDLARLLTGDA